jgi:hypothetical protein
VDNGAAAVKILKPVAAPLVGLPSLDKLCATLKCSAVTPVTPVVVLPFTPTPPTITDVSGEFTPGGQILINGQGFGYVKGTVTLTGLAKPVGGTIEAKLNVQEWQDNYILAEIPDIYGVEDSQVFVQVTNVGGASKYLKLYSFTMY